MAKLKQSNCNIKDSWMEKYMSHLVLHQPKVNSRLNNKTLYTNSLRKAIEKTYQISLTKN